MKHAVIVSLCFLPLAVIYIVMKVSLWLSSSVTEVNYVREDAKRPHGKYLENPYGDLDEENETD
jgi:hypothetical protein